MGICRVHRLSLASALLAVGSVAAAQNGSSFLDASRSAIDRAVSMTREILSARSPNEIPKHGVAEQVHAGAKRPLDGASLPKTRDLLV